MVVGETYQGRAGVAPGGAQMPGQAGPMQRNVPSPGSGGKRPSTGVIVACRIGLTVLGFVGGLTFGMFGVSGSETGGADPAATSATSSSPSPTAKATGNGEQHSADFLDGRIHIESTSIVQGPVDEGQGMRSETHAPADPQRPVCRHRYVRGDVGVRRCLGPWNSVAIVPPTPLVTTTRKPAHQL